MRLSDVFFERQFGDDWDFCMLEHLSFYKEDRKKRKYPAIYLHFPRKPFTCEYCGQYTRPNAWDYVVNTATKEEKIFVSSTESIGVKRNNFVSLCRPCFALWCNGDIEIEESSNDVFEVEYYHPEVYDSRYITVGTTQVFTRLNVKKIIDGCDSGLLQKDVVIKPSNYSYSKPMSWIHPLQGT